MPVEFPKATYFKIKRLIEADMSLTFQISQGKLLKTSERLGETKILSVREGSVKEARRLMEEYLGQPQGSVYPSDIAGYYSLEIETVFEAVKQLKVEGKVKEAK